MLQYFIHYCLYHTFLLCLWVLILFRNSYNLKTKKLLRRYLKKKLKLEEEK